VERTRAAWLESRLARVYDPRHVVHLGQASVPRHPPSRRRFRHERVENAAQIGPAIGRALASGGPYLVDVFIDGTFK